MRPSANTTTVARSDSQTDFQSRQRSSIGSLIYQAPPWLILKGQRGRFAMTIAVLLWSQTQMTSDWLKVGQSCRPHVSVFKCVGLRRIWRAASQEQALTLTSASGGRRARVKAHPNDRQRRGLLSSISQALAP